MSLHSTSRHPLVATLVAAALLALLPAASLAQAGSSATTGPNSSPSVAIDLFPSPAASAPTLQLGVTDPPPARPASSTSVGLRAVWDRLPVIRPFLGAGLSFGGNNADQKAPPGAPLAATPWLGGGLEVPLGRGAMLGCGARLTGEDGANEPGSPRKGREAGIQLTLPW